MSLEITREVAAPVTDDRIIALTEHLFARLYIAQSAELSLCFIGDAQMSQLHEQWMDLSGPTDVMSFPMDELTVGTADNLTEGVLGDIVVCIPVAEAQANSAGHCTEDEILLLITHGVLHLLGYDHYEADEKAEMFNLQDELLTAFLGRDAPTLTNPEGITWS